MDTLPTIEGLTKAAVRALLDMEDEDTGYEACATEVVSPGLVLVELCAPEPVFRRRPCEGCVAEDWDTLCDPCMEAEPYENGLIQRESLRLLVTVAREEAVTADGTPRTPGDRVISTLLANVHALAKRCDTAHAALTAADARLTEVTRQRNDLLEARARTEALLDEWEEADENGNHLNDDVLLDAANALRATLAPVPASEGADGPCETCGRRYAPWWAPHETWNLVMGGPDAKGDPGGMLCPTCFLARATAAEVDGIWHLSTKADPAAAREALAQVVAGIEGQESCGIKERGHDGCYVAESLALVREVREHYSGPPNFAPGSLVPIESVVARLTAALQSAAPAEHACPATEALARVEVLADEWEGVADSLSPGSLTGGVRYASASELRAALQPATDEGARS